MTARTVPRLGLQVRVVEVNGTVLEKAIVRVDGNLIGYDARVRGYPIDELAPGSYAVTVDAPGLEPQERSVAVDHRLVQARFILGRRGLPHYYRGPVKVPYDLPPMIAVVLNPRIEALPRAFIELAGTLGLESVAIPTHAASRRLKIFQAPSHQPDTPKRFEQELAGAGMFERVVLRAGQVVRYNKDSLSFLTNQCVVKFPPQVDARAAARTRNLEVLRELPYSANTFLLQANRAMASIELLDICNEWAANGMAIWAEPNLVSTIVPHSPNDPDLVLQAHHPIIGTLGAWNTVDAAVTAKEVNDVIIAVTDQGCLTSHEDLQAILSPDRFNFSNNTAVLLESPHGTKSCGIAAAIVDNAIGVAGIAGFDGFCRLMAVQIPTIFTEDGSATETTENDFAAMFLWCAGLANGRVVPAQLARGADVISNSWTLEGMAESGDVAAAFDAIADTGRDGRGCVVVFAAGNRTPNGTDYTLEYPLATHRAVIAVAASTVNAPEIRVDTSNFGAGIDLCAPAGDGAAGSSTYSTSITRTLPASSDYDYFGQTSAACPQVAGVAALMLALNPSLDAEGVRDLLHTTAVKIDSANTDPDGSYDLYGHSLWYGYGRLDAQAAVQAAQAAAPPPPAAVSAPAPPTGLRIVE